MAGLTQAACPELKIIGLEFRQGDELLPILDTHARAFERQARILPQELERAVHMDGSYPDCVRELLLRHWQIETGSCPKVCGL
jgi:hypothetical protein